MVYASLTPYGEEGSDRDNEVDLVAYWNRSGLMTRCVRRDTNPYRPLLHVTIQPPFHVCVNCDCLLRRERTGKGGFAHTSLLANGVWSASCLARQSSLVPTSSMPLSDPWLHCTRQQMAGGWPI